MNGTLSYSPAQTRATADSYHRVRGARARGTVVGALGRIAAHRLRVVERTRSSPHVDRLLLLPDHTGGDRRHPRCGGAVVGSCARGEILRYALKGTSAVCENHRTRRPAAGLDYRDRKSTRLNSSHLGISY